MISTILEDYAMKNEHRVMTRLSSEYVRITAELAFVERKLRSLTGPYSSDYARDLQQSELSHYQNEELRLNAEKTVLKKEIGKHSHFFALDRDGLVDIGIGCF
nr:hypothetical protein [Amylibacter sp.]